MPQVLSHKTIKETTTLTKRVLTGLLLVVFITFSIIVGSVGLLILLLLINHFAIFEFQRLIEKKEVFINAVAIHILSFLLLFFSWMMAKRFFTEEVLLIFPPLLLVLFAMELYNGHANPFQNIALTILPLIWISIPLSLFLVLSFLPVSNLQFHPSTAIGYFIILWFGDSGAFFSGKLLGKRKLFLRISPNKTWEGSIGGLLASWLAGWLNYELFAGLELDQWLILALIIYITGAFGDFSKSMLKRSVDEKDAGTILPGHGGVLDRFDSLIGSAPFAFIYLFFYA